MNIKFVTLAISSVVISIIVYRKLYPSILELCEVDTCPNCFGNDFCNEIQQRKIVLRYNSISDLTYNVFSVKNVYFAYYRDKRVVLKKLAHNSELEKLDSKDRHDFRELIDFLIDDSGVKHFRLCNKNTAASFLRMLSYKNIEHLRALLHINVEPLLLEIFRNERGWNVPKLYGFCGRLAVVEDTGRPLNEIENFDWFDRAYVARRVLQAAYDLTRSHEIFLLYLTDISPDNVAVDPDLRVAFVDLENAILKKKVVDGKTHYSEHFDEDSYSYSETQICGSSISDHNLYSTCRLLLSERAPWPMMRGGLLHDPPEIIKENFERLFLDIESCVHSSNKENRFKLSDGILENLGYILKNYTKFSIL